jgi:meiotically up-regulated gene 157 (Mug157) protein
MCRFLNESIIVDAVQLLLKTWQTEQHHEEKSTYRYYELPRLGKGHESGYTGELPSKPCPPQALRTALAC